VQLLLDQKQFVLHAFDFLRHRTDAPVSLLHKLSQLLDRAVLFYDVYLHDLDRFFVLSDLPREVRLVSLCDLFEVLHRFQKVSIGLNRFSHLLLHLLLVLFYLLRHFVSQSRLQLHLFLDESLLLTCGVFDLCL